MTHNACTLMSSEGVASRPCSGSHMPSFSRSDERTMRIMNQCPRASPSQTTDDIEARVTVRIIDVLDELVWQSF